MTIRQETKEFVRQHARGCCEYCRCPEEFATQAHSIEHITARVHGGGDDPDNLAFSCQGCNNHKFTKSEAVDSLSGQTVPLFNPRQMDWREHFAWSDDFAEIIGLTPTGRVTVRELQLNRVGVRNLRRVLHSMGEHPRE